MAKILIVFSGDLNQIGKTVEVDDEQAVVMVREGRAQFATKTEAKTAAKNTATVVADTG